MFDLGYIIPGKFSTRLFISGEERCTKHVLQSRISFSFCNSSAARKGLRRSSFISGEERSLSNLLSTLFEGRF
jgi:hypothetical protein